MDSMIILGAGHIGGFLCSKWHSEYTLYVIDHCQSTLMTLKEKYPTLHTLCLDVSKESALQELSVFLPLQPSYVVHTAGFMGDYALLHEEPLQQMEIVMRSIVYTLYYTLQVVLPRMKEKGGQIAVLSSTNAHLASSKFSSYTMAHHALVGLVKSVAIDYSCSKIKINALLCSAIHSPAYLKCQSQRIQTTAHKQLQGHCVLSIEEVYHALSLLLDKNNPIQGSLITLDGGLSCF